MKKIRPAIIILLLINASLIVWGTVLSFKTMTRLGEIGTVAAIFISIFQNELWRQKEILVIKYSRFTAFTRCFIRQYSRNVKKYVNEKESPVFFCVNVTLMTGEEAEAVNKEEFETSVREFINNKYKI